MIGAVVLAAGGSRRFGFAPKLAHPIDGRPVIAHTLACLQAASLRPIVVVTGANRARIEPIVRRYATRGPRMRLVHNRLHGRGMARSLRTGLNALPAHCDFALIALGDMPVLDARLLARIRSRARAGIDVVRPFRYGRPSHPVAISRRLFSDIAALDGDHGAKRVIDSVPADRYVRIDAPVRHGDDIDTPRAVRALLRMRRHRRPCAASHSAPANRHDR